MSNPNLGAGRYLIVHSREFPKPELIQAFVRGLPRAATVLCSPREDFNAIVATVARERGMAVMSLLPVGQHSGRLEVTNGNLLEYADVVVVFWDGECKRTETTLNRAMTLDKRVWLASELGTWTFHGGVGYSRTYGRIYKGSGFTL